MILYIVIWAVNLLLVLLKKKSIIVCSCSYLLLGILFVSNNGLLGDASVYKSHFENQLVNDGSFEIGYSFIERLLHLVGIHSYTGLLVVIFILGSFFLWLGLKNDFSCCHFVFAIIMPFIFPTYATAIRFFIASTIMIPAVRFLSEKKYLCFAILVCLAALFHLLSLVFLLFVFCNFNQISCINENRRIVLCFVGFFSILSFILSIICKSNTVIVTIAKKSLSFIGVSGAKIESYFESFTNLGGLLFFFIYLSQLLSSFFIKTNIERNSFIIFDSEEERDRITSYVILNYNINIILSVILPFIAINLVFYRLLIIGHVTNAIAIGRCSRNEEYNTFFSDIIIDSKTVFFLISCLLWFVPEIIRLQSISIGGLFEASFLV